jgi:4-hydroxy-3-methylbut-2-enyl diphosphate reductase
MAVRKVLLVSPRGFCAGVARAVKVVEDTLSIFGAPAYVKHEIVHNKHVVAGLAEKGAVTVESLAEVPDGATVVFSAHGSPPGHYEEARRRGLRIIDATCPLVTKVHLEMARFIKEGYRVIYIGHRGHIEGIGVLAEAPAGAVPIVETAEDVALLDIGAPERLVYLTQTTLSVGETERTIAALREKYPQIIAPPLADICFSTTNRQEAVRALARACDLVLIVGSKNSSNSTRLMETARAAGTAAYLVDDVSEIDPSWLEGVATVGISAGASAPEHLVQEIAERFRSEGASLEDFIVKDEHMDFSEPVELMRLKKGI